MLPDRRVLSAHEHDISPGGICLLLDDPIPVGVACTLRFEVLVNGKAHVFIAAAKSVYGVFVSQGGFRVGFSFSDDDPQRTTLIKSLSGKKTMVGPKAGGESPAKA